MFCPSDQEGLLYSSHTDVSFPVNHLGFLPVSDAVVSVGVVCDCLYSTVDDSLICSLVNRLAAAV